MRVGAGRDRADLGGVATRGIGLYEVSGCGYSQIVCVSWSEKVVFSSRCSLFRLPERPDTDNALGIEHE
jgi:hypothetical protein